MKKIYISIIAELKKRKILYIALILVIATSFTTFIPVYLKTGKISYAPDSIIVDHGKVETVDEAAEQLVQADDPPEEEDQGSNAPKGTSQQKSQEQQGSSSQTPVPPATGNEAGASDPELPSASIAFYADTQSDTDAEDANHSRVVNYLLNTDANPIFHAGDLMEDGTQASLNRFNGVTATLRTNRTFYSALGNNDRNGSQTTVPSPLYLANFSYPNNEQWYSVNIGNLHMVVLDSAFSSSSQTQLSWLASDLASTPSSKIVGVLYHHPSFSNTVHNVMRDNGVDFVVTGHYHSYSQTTSDGIHYYILSGQPSIGYMTAKIYSNSVSVNVYNESNSFIDSFTLQNR